jgi:hypothetical protein
MSFGKPASRHVAPRVNALLFENLAMTICAPLWPWEAAESGGQREYRRSPLRAGRRQRGDYVRFIAALLSAIHCRKQSGACRASNHPNREDAPRLAAALQTGDRLWCLAHRSSYLGHTMLITSIFICWHRSRSFSVDSTNLKKPQQALQNRTPRNCPATAYLTTG